MKLIAAQCPQCGASLNIAENRKVCFCSYCGTKVLLDDGSRTITHVYIDQTREKELELEKNRLVNEHASAASQMKMKKLCAIVLCALVLVVLVTFIVIRSDFNILFNFCLMLTGCVTAIARVMKKTSYSGLLLLAITLAVGSVVFMILHDDFNATFTISLMLTVVSHIVAGIVRKRA